MRRIFRFGGFTVYANDLEHAKKVLKEKYPSVSDDKISKGYELDYEKSYTYFPICEIMEEDIPYIYDQKRKGKVDEVASLPLSRAIKYESYKKREEELGFPYIGFVYY